MTLLSFPFLANMGEDNKLLAGIKKSRETIGSKGKVKLKIPAAKNKIKSWLKKAYERSFKYQEAK